MVLLYRCIVDTMFNMKHTTGLLNQVGTTVCRGTKNTYNFDVFNFDFEFAETPAIFIISRRKTDLSGKGHHKFLCIGQTDSLVKELKKHKTCRRKQKANVVCVLTQSDEKKRLQIEADIKTIYTIPCLH